MWVIFVGGAFFLTWLMAKDIIRHDKVASKQAMARLGNFGLECPECGRHRMIRDNWFVYECTECGALADNEMKVFPSPKKNLPSFSNWKLLR